MSDLSIRLAMREQMLHESNVRANRESAALLSLASDAWQSFKSAFRDECAAINADTILTRLECEEPDSKRFDVTRTPVNGRQIIALAFQFEPLLSRIAFTDMRNARPKRYIDMVGEGHTVHFLISDKAIDLHRFVTECLDVIWP